jgi:hypothetical protein
VLLFERQVDCHLQERLFVRGVDGGRIEPQRGSWFAVLNRDVAAVAEVKVMADAAMEAPPYHRLLTTNVAAIHNRRAICLYTALGDQTLLPEQRPTP